MTHKAYVVTDLGSGDGGKGGIVHKITTMKRVHTVIKRGGAQGSHGVQASSGEKFNFSQWGCGTMSGIPTHITDQMVVSPEGLLNEAAALRYQLGIQKPFSLLSVDGDALCATPYHGIASRLKELARGKQPRGTVGTGVGEAYRSFRLSPETGILVRDLRGSELGDRIRAIRLAVQSDLREALQHDFLPGDRAAVASEVELLYDDGFLTYVIDRFVEASRQVKIVDHGYLGEVILPRDGAVVVEASHGALTDRLVGFHPHTSAIRTLPGITRRVLDDAGYENQVVNIGVSRAYAVRHGAGPLPTADPSMGRSLLSDFSGDENRYQGRVRVGALDLVLLRYAINSCGGPGVFDAVAITCFDQVARYPVWRVCDYYGGATDPVFFTPSGEIRAGLCVDDTQLPHQAALGRKLLECSPTITDIPIDRSDSDSQYDVCVRALRDRIEAPVRMVSFGPSELDKLFN